MGRTLEICSGVKNKFILEGQMVEESGITEKEMTDRLEELSSLEDMVIGGETVIDDDVIAQIAGVAAREVDGVSDLGNKSMIRSFTKRVGMKESKSTGVDTVHGKKEVIVDLSLKIAYPASMPNVIIEVRKNVAGRLLNVCGMVTKEVNVNIVGIDFPERMLGKLA